MDPAVDGAELESNTGEVKQEQTQDQPAPEFAKTPEFKKPHVYKKGEKPQRERARRDRINRSLDQLQRLLETIQKDEGKYVGKMQKAEVLERAVRFLNKKRRHDKKCAGAFRAGFERCFTEVSNYMATEESASTFTTSVLLRRLNARMNMIDIDPGHLFTDGPTTPAATQCSKMIKRPPCAASTASVSQSTATAAAATANGGQSTAAAAATANGGQSTAAAAAVPPFAAGREPEDDATAAVWRPW